MSCARTLPLLDEHDRPRVRGDCEPTANTPWSARPCRQHWCRHHAVHAKFRRRHTDAASCVLDLASRGGMGLEEIGAEFGGGVCRERIRQIEKKALGKLRHLAARLGLRLEDLLPVGDSGGGADDLADEGGDA